MSDVDGLLKRCKVWLGMTRRLTPDISDAATYMVELIAAIEQQREELAAKQRRIERLEAKLDAWHDLYGSEDWRSVLAAEMEGE